MRTDFKRSFLKDLKSVRDAELKNRIKEVIELVEAVDDIRELQDMKKLSGYEHYYRIKLGDYRVGLLLQDDVMVFVRFLHRKDIYRYFP